MKKTITSYTFVLAMLTQAFLSQTAFAANAENGRKILAEYLLEESNNTNSLLNPFGQESNMLADRLKRSQQLGDLSTQDLADINQYLLGGSNGVVPLSMPNYQRNIMPNQEFLNTLFDPNYLTKPATSQNNTGSTVLDGYIRQAQQSADESRRRTEANRQNMERQSLIVEQMANENIRQEQTKATMRMKQYAYLRGLSNRTPQENAQLQQLKLWVAQDLGLKTAKPQVYKSFATPKKGN